MKINYQEPEIVTVKCTDNGNTATGEIVNESSNRLTVNVGAATMTFFKQKPGFYVANNCGLEFTIER